MNKIKVSHVESVEPKLAPPGAGVPFFHQFIFRFFVGPFVAGRTSWNESEQNFFKIGQKILSEIESLDEKQLNVRILVPPQLGLEDSSRFWSVAMCLEHMIIVGEAIMGGITQLTNDETPAITVDIAKVKPFGVMPAQECVDEFKFFINEDYRSFLKTIKNKNSNLKLNHPWFGQFNAQQWFWLLSTHQSIHLKQIREIKKRFSVV